MSVTIKFRRGNSAEWTSSGNTVLASGEPGYEIDTGRMKIGDGITPWSGLYYTSVIPTGFLAGNGIGVDLGNNGSTATIHVRNAPKLVTNVFNNTGSEISKFSVVYINGGQGDQPTIALSIASGELSSSKTYGVVADSIPNMETGQVVIAGALTGVNTAPPNINNPSGLVGGDIGVSLWLSPSVSGGVTTTKPYAPYHAVFIGTIVRSHKNEGVVEVRIQNGYELEELHNVATTGATNGQFLQYNSTSGLWVPSSSGNFSTLQVNGTGVSISGHTHTVSDITNFNSSVSGLVSGIYAPLNSPALTGTPTAPTATSGTNTNQIATTSFVRTEISNLVSSAPSTLDTLNELASALGNDPNFATTVTNSLAGKANLSGATFTGSISGPSGDFTSLRQNGTVVSVSGHTHSSSDITNFNSSVSGLVSGIYQPLLSNPVTGTGIVNHVAYWSSASGIAADSEQLVWNSSSNSLGIGTNSPSGSLHVIGTGLFASTTGLVANALLGVYSTTSGAIVFNVEGTNGSLFSVVDSMSGTLMSVNNNAGLPVFEVFSDDKIVGGRFNQNDWVVTSGGNIGLGTATPSGKLHVIGSGIFASGLNIANQTASTIASFDANKNVVSLSTSTYPSLTELSYVKDVTSAIQTQLNSKQNSLTNPVTGTGVSNHIAYWNSSSGIVADSGQLYWDSTNNRLGIGTNTPQHSLDVAGTGNFNNISISGVPFNEIVDDEVASLLVAGSGISLNYNDSLNTLTVSTSGVSFVDHTHTSSNITNFNSSVSGLLPSVSGSGFVITSFSNNTYNISVSGLQPTNSSRYIICNAGDDIVAKYTEAKALTPGGSAKSATNRAHLIVMPGVYSLSDTWTIDGEFVDIIGLGSSALERGCKVAVTVIDYDINVSADDVRIKGIGTSLSFGIIGNKPLQVFEECSGGDESFGYFNQGDASGTFTNCSGGERSFGGDSMASGKFTNCISGSESFGSYDLANGTFINCTGGNYSFSGGFGATASANGIFINCIGGDYSFGVGDSAGGTFTNCTGGHSSFGRQSIASGTFNNCTGGAGSFGFGAFAVTSGTFTNCTGGNDSFGYDNTASGTFTNCTGGDNSFGSSDTGTASGTFTNCTGGNSSFGSPSGKFYFCRLTSGTFSNPTGSGKFRLCIDGNNDVVNIDA